MSVAAIAENNLTTLSDDALIDTMVEWRRLTSRAQAGELAAVAELARRRDEEYATGNPVKVGEFVADEVAVALTLTGNAAGGLLSLALRLAQDLPLTRAALAEGRIDLARAKVIADALLGVERDVADRLERAVIGRAEHVTTGRLRALVRQALKSDAPAAASALTPPADSSSSPPMQAPPTWPSATSPTRSPKPSTTE
jgi:hypothetical protein